jgi:replication factor C subunit 3/5
VVTVNESKYHIIINPEGTGHDRYVLQSVIKRYVYRHQVNIYTGKSKLKVILIENADILSNTVQASLRRVMEKFSKRCRFIMWCYSLSKIIDPVKSRCYCIRVNALDRISLFDYATYLITRNPLLNKIKIDDIFSLINKTKGSMRILYWLMIYHALCKKSSVSYDVILNNLVELIFKIDMSNIQLIRKYIYAIVRSRKSAPTLLSDLTLIIAGKYASNKKFIVNLIDLASECDTALMNGRRMIIPLEAFCIGTMELLQKFT